MSQVDALATFVKNELSSLSSLFQTALTYSLAFRATNSIDSSSDNIVIMIICFIVVLLFCVFIQGWINTTVNIFAAQEKERHQEHAERNTAAVASITTVLINPLRMLSFFMLILVQVFTQFLATLISSWIFTLPPTTIGNAGVTEVLLISLLSLTFFWLGARALGIL